ncbi:MAG: amidase [Isosphaeraceae bacterium]|nr:amidase [Isosphaeraceae bacterium]
MMFPRETIASAALEIREGRRTCRDVLEACLTRIEEREPQVRAWVIVDRDGAGEQAAALDRERQGGRLRGPLHGIPVGIKDIIDVAGLPTAAGSRRWADHIAAADAPVVARLRAAGAVILGKTVTTPYAWIDPPPTRNPWHPDRTPGGSSSGSAAAVACGMCLGALGTQSGGSITRPAAFCGVAGLKPTHGRLSLAGILPLAPSLDHVGPIAPTVEDLRRLFEALLGDDLLALEADFTPPPRLGRLRGPFDDLADPCQREAIDRAAEVLARAGAAVIDRAPPFALNEILRLHRTILAAEAAATHEQRLAEHPDDYPPQIRALVEEGLATPVSAYIRARQEQERIRRLVFTEDADLDALLVPAAPGPAPDPATTGDPVFNSPWSFTGQPTVSFPVGRSPEGLPLAIQIVGFPMFEKRLLTLASWCEAVLRRGEGL